MNIVKRIIFLLVLFAWVPCKAMSDQEAKKKSSSPASIKQRILIDKIVARVNGSNILLSDLMLPRISKEGAPYTLDELVFEEILFQRAGEMQMLPSVLDIDRHIVAF